MSNIDKLQIRAEDVEPGDVVITSHGKRYTVKSFWMEDDTVTLFGTDGSETEYDYDEMLDVEKGQPMSTITKEFTKEQLQQIIETDHVQCGEASALARIALASLEAEPVCVIDQTNLDYLKSGSDDDVWPASRTEMGDVLLYRAAPPAPVSVPAAYEHTEDFSEYHEGWNACRSAMLQGAEPVTTAYKLPFEQWLSQQTGTIDVECGCVMTEVFFHWLRVAYEAGNSPVIQDCSEDTKRLDWLDAQNKRLNEYHGTTYGWKFDANFQRNAMMLNDSNYPVMSVRQAIDEAIAAAPQQEVKP